MKTENSGKSRMWKDAPAALCEFAGVDPARKWAQSERDRDEWAALAGQYKSERDRARQQVLELKAYGVEDDQTIDRLIRERDEARIEAHKLRQDIDRKDTLIQDLVEARDSALEEIETLMARCTQWATIARREMAKVDKLIKER